MQQRPISVTVFGILNIGYALWKVLGLLLAGIAMHLNVRGNSAFAEMTSDPVYRAWSHLGAGIGLVFAVILIASGIGLLLMQNWARILSVIYSVLEIIVVIAGAVVTRRIMARVMAAQLHGTPPGLVELFGTIGFIFGIALGLIYPVLLLVFMTRPKITQAFSSPGVPSPQ